MEVLVTAGLVEGRFGRPITPSVQVQSFTLDPPHPLSLSGGTRVSTYLHRRDEAWEYFLGGGDF